MRLLQGIASGLLGPRAFSGGLATALLDLLCHFLVGFGAVAVYLGRAGLLASCRLLVSHGQIAAVKVLLHTLPVKGTAILAELHRASCLDFVLIELDLAATFCELALSTQDEERKERNTHNARKAYDSALHFFQRLSSAPADQAHVYEKASRLNGSFERLGLNASQSGFRRISFQIIP